MYGGDGVGDWIECGVGMVMISCRGEVRKDVGMDNDCEECIGS